MTNINNNHHDDPLLDSAGAQGGDSPLVELTGLWLGTTKDGRPYMSGSVGKIRYLVLPNRNYTKGSKQPEYRLYVKNIRSKPKPDDSSVAAAQEFDPFGIPEDEVWAPGQ